MRRGRNYSGVEPRMAHTGGKPQMPDDMRSRLDKDGEAAQVTWSSLTDPEPAFDYRSLLSPETRARLEGR